jgi:signal transduction histidine kinase
MWLERFSRYLLPGGAERDKGFHSEILRLSRLGLIVIGGVQIAIAIFMMLARLLVAPDPATLRLRLLQGAAAVGIGLISIALARVHRLENHYRSVAIISGLVTAAILMWCSLLLTMYEPTEDDFIPGQVTLILLVGVTAIPLRPTDTLLFGGVCEALYVILALAAQEFYSVGSGIDSIHVLFIFMLTLLATVLTAVVYEQRRSIYEAHQATLRAAEDLRQAEARNLLAQNAASVGRLAAALSHELNNPVGALVSGVDTLLLLAGRMATSAPGDQPRLVRLQADLRRSIKESTDRLKQIVTRMQRFTNLDRAEIQSANINEILGDVAALLESRPESKVKLEMKLQPVPQLICRPQQLSAVFSNLIGNAIDALNGSDGRVIIMTSQPSDTTVRVDIDDNGRGLSKEDAEGIFDPGFKVARGRVSAVNWGMFSSRQIVREHGGDIHMESSPGAGTRVSVTLPVGAASTLQAS